MRKPFRHALLTFLMLVGASAASAQTSAQPAALDTATLIRRAFVYAFPYQEMGALRLTWLGDGAAPDPTRLGNLTHARKLSTPADRWVTAPNNDTLYSTAWLDLAQGPVRLSVPDTNGRYYSVALLDADTDNAHIVGRRETGTRAGEFVIVGPQWQGPVRLSVPDTNGRYYSVALLDADTDNAHIVGRRETGTRAGEFVIVGPQWQGPLPENARVLRIGGNDVLILMRVLVDGAADLPAVHALQDQFRLAPLSAPAQPAPLWSSAPPPKDQAARRFVWLINEMLARNPPPAYEKPLLDAFASVGVCGAACSWEKLPASTQALWERMLPELKTQLNAMTRQGLQGGGGWSATPAAMGRFGTNYCLRAGVALAFLLALEPVEAIYPSTSVDQRRQQFDGAHAYRLHLPPGGLPVEAFWSLTMYQVEADGRMYLADNSIQRYAVGDRTPGLKWNADGSLDLWIQRDNPGADKAANWLPTPEGVFALVLRAYQPKADLRDGRFALPVVERLD